MAYAPMLGPGGGLARQLRPSHALAAVCLVVAYALGGPDALAIAAVLALVEAMLSAASTSVNAAVLRRLSRAWQRVFLTAGLLVATISMRFVLPLAVVCVGAGISPATAVRLLSEDPERYRALLLGALPAINTFIGIFLLNAFLDFALSERDMTWNRRTEHPLRRSDHIPQQTGAIVSVAFGTVAAATMSQNAATKVLFATAAAVIARFVVTIITWRAHVQIWHARPTPLTGRSAFAAFCYIELINATISLDSVATAFSLTLNTALICLGLLTGASYVRSMTVYLARGQREVDLEDREYLGHVKYCVVGAIGVLMLVAAWHDVTGDLVRGVGITIILAALGSSLVHYRRRRGGPDLLEQQLKQLESELRSRDRPTAAGSRPPTSRPGAVGRGVNRFGAGGAWRAVRGKRRDRRPLAVVGLHIYLADGREHAQVEQAIEAWLSDAGVEVVARDTPVLGSWSRTLWVRIRETAKQPATREAAATLVRTAELRGRLICTVRPSRCLARLGWIRR